MQTLRVFLLVTLLATICRAQISTDGGTTNAPTQEFSKDTVLPENFTEESATDWETETTTIATSTESANNNENDYNTEIASTEAATTESSIGTQSVTNTDSSNIESSTSETVDGAKASNNDSSTPITGIEKSTQTSDDIDTTTETNTEEDTTTESAAEFDLTTLESDPICDSAGVTPHESDCHQYYDCWEGWEASADGKLHLTAKPCPKKQAFNIELNRCSRDISSCPLDINCTSKGSMPDPASNSSYYLCEPRLDGQGFRIFHVNCASYEMYYPLFGRCYRDPSVPIFNWQLVKDIDIVKAELKLLKKQDKLKLKQEMDNKKKQEKEAKKKAKEEEKINKMKFKQEAESFACVAEGNFASKVADHYYITCISKKTKWKATPMKCGGGQVFDPETGVCGCRSTNDKTCVYDDDSSASDEEDDD